jgi:hypothetical protein
MLNDNNNQSEQILSPSLMPPKSDSTYLEHEVDMKEEEDDNAEAGVAGEADEWDDDQIQNDDDDE